MMILTDFPVVKNKANFGGWPSLATCPSWFQGQNVPARENAAAPRYRGDPNRVKQDACDKSRKSGVRAAFRGQYRRLFRAVATFVGRVKQSQFADDGIHFNIFVARELCEIALETRHEKQSQFRGWPSGAEGVHGSTLPVAKPVFNGRRFSILCRKRVWECTI